MSRSEDELDTPIDTGSQNVTGYRKQRPSELELVNENKSLENVVGDQVAKVMGTLGVDKRWAAIARTHFQEGFMALNRAVFQPESRL